MNPKRQVAEIDEWKIEVNSLGLKVSKNGKEISGFNGINFTAENIGRIEQRVNIELDYTL